MDIFNIHLLPVTLNIFITFLCFMQYKYVYTSNTFREIYHLYWKCIKWALQNIHNMLWNWPSTIDHRSWFRDIDSLIIEWLIRVVALMNHTGYRVRRHARHSKWSWSYIVAIGIHFRFQFNDDLHCPLWLGLAYSSSNWSHGKGDWSWCLWKSVWGRLWRNTLCSQGITRPIITICPRR